MKEEVRKELEETLKIEPETKKNPFADIGNQVRDLSNYWDAEGKDFTKAAVVVQWKNENGMVFERTLHVDPASVKAIVDAEKDKIMAKFKEKCRELAAN